MKPTSFSFSSLLRRLRPSSPSPSHNPADDLPFNGLFAFTEGDYRLLLTWELELQRIAFELLDSHRSAAALLLETSSAFELPSELTSPLHDSESWRVHIAGLHRVGSHQH